MKKKSFEHVKKIPRSINIFAAVEKAHVEIS